MANAPPIVLRDVVKQFQRIRAVDGVSLSIAQGELYALLGPNGAGKTTTVELIEGYLAADEGLVRVLGEDPRRRSVKLRESLGVVLQEHGPDPFLRVDELLSLYASFYSSPAPAGRLLKEVELEDCRRSLVRRLSGGQRRRLQLALALIGEPEVVVLDEPTTGLDPGARRRTWALIRRRLTEGRTVLLTTHYIEEAEALASRVGIMRNGRIIAQDTPDALRRKSPHAVIRLEIPDETSTEELELSVPCRRSGGVVEIPAWDVTDVVSGLVNWSRKHSQSLQGLEIRRAALEDIYLALVDPDVEQPEADEEEKLRV